MGTEAEVSDYGQEQAETLSLVRGNPSLLVGIREKAASYFEFRRRVDDFLFEHFAGTCTDACYRSRLSACCTRDGILTFFADVALNALLATDEELDRMAIALTNPDPGFKCRYLGPDGCLWRLKPLVCAMFLCDPVQKRVFGRHPEARETWDHFRSEEKNFRWPDRPVLFDGIEALFLDAGLVSPLMYLHNSPGLLRIKKRAGLLL